MPMLSSDRLPTIKGKELPPPQKNKCYSNIEIIQLSLVHKKSSVIKAIHESSFGPKRAALYRCFPPQDEAFSNETVKSLLCKYETGSDEWKKTVNLISTNADDSVCEEIIYNMLGIVKNVSSERDDLVDDELDEINPTNNEAICMQEPVCKEKNYPTHRFIRIHPSKTAAFEYLVIYSVITKMPAHIRIRHSITEIRVRQQTSCEPPHQLRLAILSIPPPLPP
eukprot:scaffold66591_cov73-Cyclotella_meneghiniana.AAC.1